MKFDDKHSGKAMHQFKSTMMILNLMNKVSFSNRYVPLIFYEKSDTQDKIAKVKETMGFLYKADERNAFINPTQI